MPDTASTQEKAVSKAGWMEGLGTFLSAADNGGALAFLETPLGGILLAIALLLGFLGLATRLVLKPLLLR